MSVTERTRTTRTTTSVSRTSKPSSSPRDESTIRSIAHISFDEPKTAAAGNTCYDTQSEEPPRKRRRTSLANAPDGYEGLEKHVAISTGPEQSSLDTSSHATQSHIQDQNETVVAALKPIQPLLSLTFNIPLGFHGPLTINLDPTQLTAINESPEATRLRSNVAAVPSVTGGGDACRATAATAAEANSTARPRSQLGFLDLPPEIRNEIYELVFVGEEACRIRFDHPDNFSRSAAFLRTCKQVESEGTSVLYSQPEFYFRRQIIRRTPLWSTASKEVGYEDIHRFLLMVGRRNIAKLRSVFFLLEDATPCLNPRLKTADQRRYVRDEHLLASIKLLVDHGRLRVLRLGFFGRRAISPADAGFITLLKSLRSDTVEVLVRRCHPDWPVTYSSLSWPKIKFEIAVDIKATILRKDPFYELSAPSHTAALLTGHLIQPAMCGKCGDVHIGAKGPERKPDAKALMAAAAIVSGRSA